MSLPDTEEGQLKDLNVALRELVRLQLAGEIDADAAWRARRDMLASVESSWTVLAAESAPADGLADAEAATAPAAPAARLRAWLAAQPGRLRQRVWRLRLWSLLLVLALATFWYVGTL